MPCLERSLKMSLGAWESSGVAQHTRYVPPSFLIDENCPSNET